MVMTFPAGCRPGRLLALLMLTGLAVPAGAVQGAPAAARLPAYPVAPHSDQVDVLHVVPVADPYRALEELDAPATRQWLDQQRALTEATLAALPERTTLRQRIGRLHQHAQFGVPFRAGAQVLQTWNPGTLAQSLLVQVAADGRSRPLRTVLDPNRIARDGALVVTGYVASRHGRWLAYGVSEGGSDWTDWHVRNLQTGQDLPEVLRHTKYYAPVFDADEQGLFYSAFPAPAAGQELSAQDLGNAAFHHVIGTPASTDQKCFELPGQADWQFKPDLSGDGRWLVMAAGQGQVGDSGREDIYVQDRSTPGQPVRALVTGSRSAWVFVGSDAGQLFFLTNDGAPNGRIVTVDPANGDLRAARTVIAEGSAAIDVTQPSVTLVHHRLIVRSIAAARHQVTTYALDGSDARSVRLPGAGSVEGFAGQAGDTSTFYTFTNLITPPTVYRLDLPSGRSQVFRQATLAFNAHGLVQQQTFYTARDGTRVPVTLAFRRGLQRNGHNPTVLYGYGGFGIALLPEFSEARVAWLERGGVYALAHLRGGGELGERWHLQGQGAHKQVVFNDFIDAAQWLVDQRYTRPRQLAIAGDSNGGLLVGAVLTQQPALFGAALAGVGVMDMLRFDRFGQGAGWAAEYGSPAQADDFAVLRAYSPVHNVRTGLQYPATLVITGDHDTRVMPMHSFKFAAALQAAQAGAAPVLLYLETGSGHSGGGRSRGVPAARL